MTTPKLLVPDFSEWQGTAVNWSELTRGGFPAAIIRGYNGHRADQQFARNRHEAHAAGIRALGLYAFLVPGHVEDQAAAFVSLVGKLQPGEWPILDYEATGLHPQDIDRWITHVAGALHGASPWLYTGEYIYRTQHLDKVTAVPAQRTWLAAYGAHEPTEGHELWQYTDHLAGLPGLGAHAVDCSTFHGTIDQLLAVVHPTPPKPTEPTAPKPGPAAHARFPYPVGIGPGKSHPSARPLQRALKLTGWMAHDVHESDHYGAQTEKGVGGFNRKHGFNSPGHIWDPAIGPHGWALLMTLAYGRD